MAFSGDEPDMLRKLKGGWEAVWDISALLLPTFGPLRGTSCLCIVCLT